MGIHLRMVKIVNLYYVGNVEVKWVSNPFDLSETSPTVIGIIGTNGSGKSTILSRAIPWLIHPESNKFADNLTEGIFETEVPALSVEIVFEYNGHIYEAKRNLNYHLENGSWSHMEYSLYRHGDGRPENVTHSWDNIFGKDTGTPQPYVCEHQNLTKIARKMASNRGLRDFSDNLGHHELLGSLSRLDLKEKLKIELAQTSTLTGPNLKKYNELRGNIEHIENELHTKKTEHERLTQMEEGFFFLHGAYEDFYKDFHKVELARDQHQRSQARKKLAIRDFIRNDILVASTLAKLKLHLVEVYGIDTETLPVTDVSDNMLKSAKSFKRIHEDIYNRINEQDKAELERIIAAVKNLDLTSVKHSDPSTMGSEVFDFRTKVQGEQRAAAKVKQVARDNLEDENVTKATLDAWSDAREAREGLEPQIRRLDAQQSQFESIKNKISTHDEAEPTIKSAGKNRKLISIIRKIMEDSVVDFEKKSQSDMLLSAEQALNQIYHYETWKISQEAGTIHPIKNGVQLDLAKASEVGGPSSGQARTIALCIMVERYLKTECKIPLILDDAYKDISEETDIQMRLRTSAEEATLKRAVNNNSQVIWANITPPLSSDAVLARITSKEAAESDPTYMSPPWDGKPVIGIPVEGGGE